MQRYPSILPEFTAADGQHSGLQVKVLQLEVACFAEAKTRDAEQSKQRIIDPGQQRTGHPDRTVWRERHMESGMQELFDLLIRIKVRSGPLGFEGQKPHCRNLRAWIACTSIPRELTDMTEAARPVCRLDVGRLLGPSERQRLGYIGGPTAFHERREVRQRCAGLPQLK